MSANKSRTCKEGHLIAGDNAISRGDGKGHRYKACRACHNHKAMLAMRKHRKTPRYRIRMGYPSSQVREARLLTDVLRRVDEAAKKVTLPTDFVQDLTQYLSTIVYYSNQVGTSRG